MREKFIFIAILISLINSSFADNSRLKIFIVPPAHKIDWSTNASILKSFAQSQSIAIRDNNFGDAQRRAIGHVVAKLDCSGESRWTGLSVNSFNVLPSILREGVAGMFSENPHGFIQSEDEIKKFLLNNSRSSIVLNFPVKDEDCVEMIRMDDHFRHQEVIWFAPLLDTFSNYQSGKKLGGSGSTYVVALKKLDRLNFIDYNQWMEQVRLPNSAQILKFESVQSMWEFGNFLPEDSLRIRYVERLKFKAKKFEIPGIEFKNRNMILN